MVFLFKIYRNDASEIAKSEVIGFLLCAHYKNNRHLLVKNTTHEVNGDFKLH